MRVVRPHVGFVVERSLGHITHGDNLSRVLPSERAVDAELFQVPWEVEGWPARIPVFNRNWTVRAGLRARRGIRQMHRTRALDGLFVHTQVPAVLSPDWLHRVPTVVSLDATPLQYDELGAQYEHRQGSRPVEGIKWRANQTCLRRAAHIVTWSAWAKAGVVEGYGIDPDGITVIPPGVTPDLWHPAGRRPGDEVVRILFVGGDLARKGGDVLLRAFAELRADLAAAGRPAPRVELHLVTKAQVPSAPAVTVHRLAPNSPELVALYGRCDVFCLPTRGDCLPMVLSEAGAAELPLVATAVAAIPEIVRDGETGMVVPVDDVAALVKVLRLLVEQPELRRRLGRAARRLVDERHDAATNAHQLVEVILQAIERCRGPR